MMRYSYFNRPTCTFSYTNQKVCSSHQNKRESLVAIVTPKYGVMCTSHHFGVKYMPNSVRVHTKFSDNLHHKQCELILTLMRNYFQLG